MEYALDTPLRDGDYQEHVRTYSKFVRYARAAAIAGPFFVAFVLYWTQ